MTKAMTLSEFLNNDYPDGHYAVWKVGKILQDDSFLYGFSGAVVEYNQHGGFKNYPDWMDDTDESEINIILLHELPSVEELRNGDF
jgi:hypothetical protein